MTRLLTPRQRATLKARAHALEPVVQIGQAGISEAVLAEVDRSLTAHGLIKIKLGGADRTSRHELTNAVRPHGRGAGAAGRPHPGAVAAAAR